MIKRTHSQIGRHLFLAVGEIGAVADFKVMAAEHPQSGDPCLSCCLYDIVGCERIFGSCMAELRPDMTSIIYKKINENE